jgi:hypothetical protein
LDGGMRNGRAHAAVQVARAWLSGRVHERYISVFRVFTEIGCEPVPPPILCSKKASNTPTKKANTKTKAY